MIPNDFAISSSKISSIRSSKSSSPSEGLESEPDSSNSWSLLAKFEVYDVFSDSN